MKEKQTTLYINNLLITQYFCYKICISLTKSSAYTTSIDNPPFFHLPYLFSPNLEFCYDFPKISTPIKIRRGRHIINIM